MKDALGNNIEIGSIYGCSILEKGSVYITIGKAIGINNENILLHIIKTANDLYSNELVLDDREMSLSNCIKEFIPSVLFKLENEKESWKRKDR
jgi:hypothetical protein